MTTSSPLQQYPYGGFRQLLQREQLSNVPWVENKIVVAMADPRTNVIVTTMDDTRTKFTMRTVGDHFASTLLGDVQEKYRRYSGNHGDADGALDARQLDHVLKEISQMHVNRIAKAALAAKVVERG